MTTKKKEAKEKEPEKTEEKAQPTAPTAEQMQQSAAQAIQSYFTKEINDQVHEMTNDVMFSLIRQLEGSEFWIAILRYNNLRLLTAQSAINTMDPVTQPSAISRTQGTMTGIVDLQNAVIQLVEIERAAAAEIKDINETF